MEWHCVSYSYVKGFWETLSKKGGQQYLVRSCHKMIDEPLLKSWDRKLPTGRLMISHKIFLEAQMGTPQWRQMGIPNGVLWICLFAQIMCWCERVFLMSVKSIEFLTLFSCVQVDLENYCASELYARPLATRASPHFGRGLVVTDPLKMFYMGILDSIHHLLVYLTQGSNWPFRCSYAPIRSAAPPLAPRMIWLYNTKWRERMSSSGRHILAAYACIMRHTRHCHGSRGTYPVLGKIMLAGSSATLILAVISRPLEWYL